MFTLPKEDLCGFMLRKVASGVRVEHIRSKSCLVKSSSWKRLLRVCLAHIILVCVSKYKLDGVELEEVVVPMVCYVVTSNLSDHCSETSQERIRHILLKNFSKKRVPLWDRIPKKVEFSQIFSDRWKKIFGGGFFLKYSSKNGPYQTNCS